MPDNRVIVLDADGDRIAAKTRDPRSPGAWRTEVAALSSIQDPHVVRLRGFGPNASLALEGHGLDLRQVLQAGECPEPIEVLRDLARALCACHQAGVVHNDVKPENLVQSTWGWVLVDFELCSRPGPMAKAGTPAYIAPERLQGQTGFASDWYSFGVVAFELLTGKLPFDGPDLLRHQLHTSAPEVAGAWGWLIEDLLQKDPNQRPTADAILQALGVHLEAAPVRAKRHPAQDERGITAVVPGPMEIVARGNRLTAAGRTVTAAHWAAGLDGSWCWWNGSVIERSFAPPCPVSVERLERLAMSRRDNLAWATSQRVVWSLDGEQREWRLPPCSRMLAVGEHSLWVACHQELVRIDADDRQRLEGTVRALEVGPEGPIAVWWADGLWAGSRRGGVWRQQRISEPYALYRGGVVFQGQDGWLRRWDPRHSKCKALFHCPPLKFLWIDPRGQHLVGRTSAAGALLRWAPPGEP